MKEKFITQPLSRQEKIILIVLGLAALLGLYFGWRRFWYLTDDAFIYFRYASNSLFGYGYVWNPPPFRHVEGYTSFLWLVLLDLVWRVLNVAPPVSANWLSLVMAACSLIVFALMVINLPWTERLRPFRLYFLALGLLGVISNTTFLAWTSSGLETALFNLSVLLWVYCFLYLPFSKPVWGIGVSVAAVLIYLSRPDGILFAGATIVVILVRFLADRRANPVSALALIGIPIHLVWRKSFYGEWLPNTYYAKVIAGRIWWQSGYRYLFSFIIEYALWLWMALFVAYLGLQAFRFIRARRSLIRLDQFSMPALAGPVVAGTLLLHFLYYTFVVGGDHFEYRIYSHLIPLLFLVLIWVLNRINRSAVLSVSVMFAFIVVAWPVQWLDWSVASKVEVFSENRTTRLSLSRSVRTSLPETPAFLFDYLAYYDRLQAWLREHAVCIRTQSSRLLTEHLLEVFPSRQRGLAMDGRNYPVGTQEAVGVMSWSLPRVNIIDLLGLNDYVIARNPILRSRDRMAHERQPPAGYVECFEPDIRIRSQKIIIKPRAIPLTAERIVACEQEFAVQVSGQQP